MPLREFRTALRGATYRGDVPEIIRLLEESTWPEEVLQLVGGALLVALSSSSPECHDLAHRCVARLRDRAWDGDADLAEAMCARLGESPQPMLRPIPVDLAELADVREGDPAHGGGRVDLRTGEVWPEMSFDDDLEDSDDEEDDDDEDREDSRWLWVDPVGSRPGYRDMEIFIDRLDDAHDAELLTVAISGPGAFRRFKQVLASRPEAADRWYAFSEDRTRGRARAWLAAQGYTPAPRRAAPGH
ncbi:UPF0158 family protein [Ornithinimicrobium sufpigmenti]|uniref:UPF0158 family protein n=1 Tax=Ornithinimicrobium sufpigmenti TaxID=2508882 RepID=UPI0015E1986E|nr:MULTISPECIES: UPF0158 family protein [unclassified Ornithinimicrobium]